MSQNQAFDIHMAALFNAVNIVVEQADLVIALESETAPEDLARFAADSWIFND